jgi:hypothetical protein
MTDPDRITKSLSSAVSTTAIAELDVLKRQAGKAEELGSFRKNT